MRVSALALQTLAFASSLLANVAVFCSYISEQDGSILVSRRCDCDSVEFWLPVRANGSSNYLSYEEIGQEISKRKQLLSKTDFDRGFRLWLPKHCRIELDTVILRKDSKIDIQSIAKNVLEVWVKNDPSTECFAASLKCEIRSTCIGIGSTFKDQDVIQSSQRKLLMFESYESENTSTNRHHGVLLSIFAFCSMVILVALCGKAENNAQQSVAYDTKADSVIIISSEKLKTMSRKSAENEVEVVEVKVDNSSSLKTDRNSNNSKEVAADVDLSSIIVTASDPQKDDAKPCVDDIVLGKEKRGDSIENMNVKGDEMKEGRSNSETNERVEKISGRQNGEESEIHGSRKDKQKEEKKNKQKEKEVKDKERNKDMRSKHSHNSTEKVNHKSSTTKMKFSLKGVSSTSNTYDEPKITKGDKRRSKKNHDGCSPVSQGRPPFAGDRRSFVNRELPKRPSEERENPPGEDDDDDDDNYEHVVIKMGPPRSPGNLNVPSPVFDNDSGVYDSVDDTKEGKVLARAGPVAGEGEDAYEVVEVRTKTTKDNRELYESVGVVYKDPSTKPRRSSDVFPRACAPKTDAERKTLSLGRGASRECAPTPPPLEGMEIAKESHHHIIDDIEPYTVTVRKGDRIIQETNFEALLKDEYKPASRNVAEEHLSEVEKDMLYTKVDKVKQKKDRMEAEMSAKGEISEGNEISGGTQASASLSVVAIEEHPYEVVSQHKDPENTLQKKDSFEETEDYEVQHYEEVQTKKDERHVFV